MQTRSARPTRASYLVYDADCGFCTASANWLAVRFRDAGGDPGGRRIQPWQQTDLESLGLTRAQVTAAAWWIQPGVPAGDGSDRRAGDAPPAGRLSGHLAIAAALRSCRGAWPLVGVVIAAPGISWVAGHVYAFIARHRDRMPGGTDSCAV